jgi:hypothetical protein
MSRAPRKLVGTFAELIRYRRVELTLHCEACHHRAAVSVPALARRLGAEHEVQAFIERCVCKECGARWPKLSVTVTPVIATGLF